MKQKVKRGSDLASLEFDLDFVVGRSIEEQEDEKFRFPLAIKTPNRGELEIKGNAVKDAYKLQLSDAEFALNQAMIRIGDNISGPGLPRGCDVVALDAQAKCLVLNKQCNESNAAQVFTIKADKKADETPIVDVIITSRVFGDQLVLAGEIMFFAGNGSVMRRMPINDVDFKVETFLKQARVPGPTLEELQAAQLAVAESEALAKRLKESFNAEVSQIMELIEEGIKVARDGDADAATGIESTVNEAIDRINEQIEALDIPFNDDGLMKSLSDQGLVLASEIEAALNLKQENEQAEAEAIADEQPALEGQGDQPALPEGDDKGGKVKGKKK